MAPPLLGVGEYVCDFGPLMRARLLFGFYNQLAVPKRYQIAAKLYCLSIILLLTIILYIFFLENKISVINTFFISRCVYHGFNILWCIFTEDKHISSYCFRINLTDVTVDSAIIFYKIEKKPKYLFPAVITGKILLFLIFCACSPNFYDAFHWLKVTSFLLDISVNLIFVSNFVVFCVYKSRLHLLRLKLERYGFNSRHCRIGINIYCDVYSKIVEDLQKRSCIKTTKLCSPWQQAVVCLISFLITQFNSNVMMFIPITLATTNLLAPIFGYCAELESAARHVEAIREFTVTELIKQPCERSRRAMLELLALTEAAPARVSLCRAVRVNARLAVAVLSFCSARIILLLTLRQ